ncbi:MAG: hypothetical protein JF610_15305, partial [Acidobacteria bacterium]|nr:hypothetical protein [Acidobacteriota bacterium]
MYRALFGYRIGRGVRIGLVLLDADEVDLGDSTTIGHFNLVTRVGRLVTGRGARLGFLNVIRGGERVELGPYAEVMRFNVLNAIPDHDCTTAPVSRLEIGAGSVVVSGHR